MSEPRSQQDLIRMAWIAALRRDGHRQCAGQLSNRGRVCALGLLRDVAGRGDLNEETAIGRLAGLSPEQICTVILRNDGKFAIENGHLLFRERASFAEIADMVEGWSEGRTQ